VSTVAVWGSFHGARATGLTSRVGYLTDPTFPTQAAPTKTSQEYEV
jgi:hypothetical protein